jgi:NADH dehydrogenase [ubiquinone] 1 alpha subcomplex assembly factor 1
MLVPPTLMFMKPLFFSFSLITLFFGMANISIVPSAGGANKKDKDKHLGKIVFDFKEENPEENWITVNDNVMGGRSVGGFSFKKKKLIFSGSTNTNGGGFSSIRTKPMELGLGDKDGIIIRFKGDGRTYKLGIRMEGNSVAYRADFKTEKDSKGWLTVKVPFDSLSCSWRGMSLPKDRHPLNKDRIQSIGFMIYDKKDGPFKLQVDSIKAYSESE